MVSPWIGHQNRRTKDTTPRAASPDGRSRPAGEGRRPTPGNAAPSIIHLRVEDGLLMAFGPDGDPLPPGLLTTTGEELRDHGPPLYDGHPVDHERMVEILLAQRTGALAAEGRRCDRWIEAMLGVAGQFEPTPAGLLATEADPLGQTKGHRLQFALPSGETLVIRDAHPGYARSTNLGQLVVGNNSLSIKQLATLPEALRQSLDARSGTPTTGPAGCLRLGQGDAIFLDFGGCRRARLVAAEPVWCGQPMLELSLSDGRGVGVDHLRSHLRRGEQLRDTGP